MEGKRIAQTQDIRERGTTLTNSSSIPALANEHVDSHCPGKRGHCLAKLSVTYNAEGRSPQINDRMIDQAKLSCVLPAAILHIIAIRDQITAQRQHQHQSVLW